MYRASNAIVKRTKTTQHNTKTKKINQQQYKIVIN